MAQRDDHIYADYGELMECLLHQRTRFATEDEFENYTIGAVQRFLLDLEHLGIELPFLIPASPHFTAPTGRKIKLGN